MALMPDQRRVGHAIRRRMGAPSSHLGMAAAEATASDTAQIPFAGGRYMGTGGHKKGVPDTYETGTGSYGRGGPPLGDSSAFASGVSGSVLGEPHPSRGRLSAGESSSARLTVSPSMKMPEQSPVPTQGAGRIVPSMPSRQGSFNEGQQEIYGG